MSTLETNLVQPSTGTALTIGASGDTITVPSGATFNVAGTLQSGGSAITQGITMADQYRVTANITSNADPISSNIERIDTSGQGTLGSAMSVSSGVFTFPSTGIYLVLANPWFSNGSDLDAQSGLSILVTTNNSSYSTVASAAAANKSGSAVNFTCPTSSLIDVTDTSNVKVKFATFSMAGTSSVFGDTSNVNYTHFTFLRLGDT